MIYIKKAFHIFVSVWSYLSQVGSIGLCLFKAVLNVNVSSFGNVLNVKRKVNISFSWKYTTSLWRYLEMLLMVLLIISWTYLVWLPFLFNLLLHNFYLLVPVRIFTAEVSRAVKRLQPSNFLLLERVTAFVIKGCPHMLINFLTYF